MTPNGSTRIEELEKRVQRIELDFATKLGFVYGAAWAGGIIGTALLGVIIWALTQILPAAKLILQDYYSHHPTAEIQQKTSSESMNPAYASDKRPPQDAKGW